jgi:hypothetical protein
MTKAAVLALLPAGAIAGALRARQLQPFRASTDNVTYAGCFVDSVQQRVLTQGLFFDDFTLTAEVCSEHCLSMGLPISGTEYTAECVSEPPFVQSFSSGVCSGGSHVLKSVIVLRRKTSACPSRR